MKRAQEDVKMTKMSCRRKICQRGGRNHFSRSHGAFGGVGMAYGNKGKDAGPEGVVGQLPPAPLVHDGALVRDAAEQVDGRGDQRDDAKDTAGPQRLLRLADAPAGGHGARLEEEGAFVRVGADEREVRLWGERVPVTGEGDEGGFPSDGFLAFGALVALAVVVSMFVIVVVVVVVVIVMWAVELAREEAVGFRLAGGAVGVVQDELATSEEWLRRCLPVWCTIRGCLRVFGEFFRECLPYGICLFSNRIKRTDVPPKLLFYSDHILHRLNDRRAEVHGEVGIIVVTSSMPAFYPVILVRFLVIYQGLDCDGVEIVGISIGGVVDSTWFCFFWVCCEGCRAEEEGEQGGGEDGAHCDLERGTRTMPVRSGLQEASFAASCNIIAWTSLDGDRRIILQAVAELVLSEIS